VAGTAALPAAPACCCPAGGGGVAIVH
jgi:hypothetical protein